MDQFDSYQSIWSGESPKTRRRYQEGKHKRSRKKRYRRTHGGREKSKVGYANFMLCHAAAEGKLEEVKKLIETCQCDPRHKTRRGITALHCASYCGQLEVVQYLINEANCNPVAEDINGECPLAYSTKCIMKNLVKDSYSKSDIYLPLYNHDQIFHTALYLIRNRLTQSKAEIIDKKKYLNVLRLPLYVSPHDISLSDQSELIEFIVSIHGGDGTDRIVEKEVCTCFKIALGTSNLNLAELLLSICPIYIKNSLVSDLQLSAKIQESLHEAIKDRELSLIKLMIELDICKPTLISFKTAIKMDDHDIVHRLIQSADISLLSELIFYILDLAKKVKCTGRCNYCDDFLFPSLPLVNLILTNCISRSESFIRDAKGNNPLHLACNSILCKDIISFINEIDSSYQMLPNDGGKLPLHTACEVDHKAIKLISSYPELDVNFRDKDGCTPLHILCKSLSTDDGGLDCCKYLILQKKCSINTKNNSGKLPLHILLETLAHSRVNKDELEQLLKLCSDNTNINVQDNDGNTPLHVACIFNVLKAVLYFASNSCCNKNLPNINGCLPVHCAISSHMPLEAVIAVNEGCTRIPLESNNGVSALQIALRTKQLDTVRYFAKSMATCCSHVSHRSEVYNNFDISLLCQDKRDMKILRILANKQNINQTDDEGNSPIHVACQKRNLEIAKFLIEDLNCDLSCQDAEGRLPLHISCLQPLEFVKLTSYGCDVNICDNNGNTPLHIACQAGSLDNVCYLVETFICEPSKVKRDHHNMLPVDYACKHSLEMVKLVSPSVSILKDVKNFAVKTLNMACSHGALDVVQYLINQNGYHLLALGGNHSALLYACGLLNRYNSHSDQAPNIHTNVVKFLISKCSYDPLKVHLPRHSKFESLFQYACHHNNLNLIKALTVNLIDMQDHKGNTPLHYACAYKCTKIVHFLVNSNCDQTITNKKRELALHIACSASLEIIQLLTVQHDAIINSKDDDGNTPLHIACAHKHNDIIEYLLKQKSCRANIPNKDGNLALHILLNPNNYDSGGIVLDDTATNHSIILMVIQRNMKAVATYNDKGLSPIVIAILKQEIDFFEALSESGYNFPKRNVLQYACLYRKPKVIQWLIQHGTRHRIKNGSGNLPQHLCFMGKYSFCEQSLMQLGSLDIYSQNKDNNTIIHMICKEGDLELLRQIIPCDIYDTYAFSIQNSDKDTPLHLVIPNMQDEHAELIELMATSDNVNIQNIVGDTPLHIACRECDGSDQWVRIITVLICKLKSSVDVQNNNCDSPLNLIYHIRKQLIQTRNKSNENIFHVACINRHSFSMIVSPLIKSVKLTADTISKIIGPGTTALHLACIAGDLDTVQLFVDCDPLAQITDTVLLQKSECVSGDTALHVACRFRYRNLKIVRYLLTTKHKKALKILNTHNELPFHLACDSEEMIKVFVGFKHNFDCNSQTSSGNTFLHIVCQRLHINRSSIALLLYKFKCKPCIPNNNKDLPLHLACEHNASLDIIKMLSVSLSNDQIMLQNGDGNTALHLLLLSRYDIHNEKAILDKVKFFTSRTQTLIRICNNDGNQVIHLACHYYGLSVVKHFHKMFESLEFPSQLLHESCHNKNPDILEFMLTNIKYHNHDINLPDKNCDIPLHLAIRHKKSMKCISDIIQLTGNINQINDYGNTPLHEACRRISWDSIDKEDDYYDYDDHYYYYDDDYYDYDDDHHYHYDYYYYDDDDDDRVCSECQDSYKRSSDKPTTEEDALYVVKELLKVETINVSVQNSLGETPLYYLIETRSLYDGLKLMLNHRTFNANLQNEEGLTLLHILCEMYNDSSVQLLLSSSKTDPSLKDNLGRTPITLTDDPQIMKLLIKHGADPQPLYDMHCKFFNEFSSTKPPPTPVKLLVIGHPTVGKTTLIQSLQNEYSESTMFATVDRTTGIIPTKFRSNIYGDVTFYDFAGQPEYYASHDAVIHSTIKNVPPIVLILVDLTTQRNIILSQIHYWTNFIENQFAKLNDEAHLIIVGSHADIIALQGIDPSEMINQVKCDIESQKMLEHKNIALKDTISIDCTKPCSNEMKKLQQALKQSTNELREGGVMHFSSHCFLVLLYETFKDTNYLTIGQILKIVEEKADYYNNNPLYLIPSESKEIVHLCRDLSDKGHVYFIEHPNVVNSLLVLDKEPLLHKLSGSLFAPSNFPQHCPLSYSTGVIPLTRFERHCRETLQIVDWPASMLLEFLTKMEYCREVTDQAVVESIVKQEGYSNSERYFFFPNLVSLDRPTDKWTAPTDSVSYKCGWLIQCSREGEFFSPHFIQALLLRLIFSFTIQKEVYDSKDRETFYGESDVGHNQVMNMVIRRKCSVWKNGMYWQEASGVKTIIDIIDQRTLVLLMNCQCGSEESLLERRSMIISMVLSAKREFCSKAKLLEYFIHPEQIMHPLPNIDNSHLFAITCITTSIKAKQPFVLNDHDKKIEVNKLLYFEPYAELNAETVGHLCNQKTLQQQINDMWLLLLAEQLSHRFAVFNYLCGNPNSLRPEAVWMQAQSALHHNNNYSIISSYNRLVQISEQRFKGGVLQDLRDLFDRISIFRGRQPPQGKTLIFACDIIILEFIQ